jgi:hypothetical protein
MLVQRQKLLDMIDSETMRQKWDLMRL